MSLIQDSSGGVMIKNMIKTSTALYTVKMCVFVSVVVRILGKLAGSRPVVGLHLGMILIN